MRAFDDLWLTPVRPLKPKEIRALRLREGASQAVFARYHNVTTGLVSPWERGEKRPQGASLKLLALVAKKAPGPLRDAAMKTITPTRKYFSSRTSLSGPSATR